MELHEKIAAMRTYITEHGFCKWQLEDTQGRVCLVGADMKATDWLSGPYVGTFLSALATELGLVEPNTVLDGPGRRVHYSAFEAHIALNNHPDTTEADIIEFLHTAEVKAKELSA